MSDLIEQTIEFLAEYFGKNLKPKVRHYYVEKLKGYDGANFKRGVDNAIEAGVFDRFPRLNELKIQLDRYCKTNSSIHYNRDSDHRFPVGLMWEAWDILIDKGEQKFQNYCENVKMPLDDRQRVLDKHKFAFDIKDLADA